MALGKVQMAVSSEAAVAGGRDGKEGSVLVERGVAFALAAGVMSVARLKAPFPIMLADRFLPDAGWIEIGLLAAYASFLVGRLIRSSDTGRIRRGIWLAFSAVFFTQLLIGIAGVDRLLMTGRLHVPVPAVVIGGPLYRGDRVFMPVLFLATIVLVGPAWCSHLCYFGAWDALAAHRKPARVLGAAWSRLRYALFVLTPIVALSLRFAGASGELAAAVAGGFGGIGALCMATLSTRRGVMVHCSSLCPLGVASMLLGKVSPFRVRIGQSCTDCGRCTRVCRYNALNAEHVRRRRPGANCSLCGDCLGACREGALVYRFPGLSGASARRIFLVLVVSLHAVFLGVARI